MLLALACASAAPAAAGAAEPLQIANLTVEGGEAAWHADNVFRIEWDQVPAAPPSARAALYRLFDEGGKLVAGPGRYVGAANGFVALEVPPVPGIYTLEAWLEDSEGQMGPPASATLRFDDAPPAAPDPAAPAGWLTTGEKATVAIGHPSEPPPLSGIRGYAVSLDQGGGGSPCANPDRCTLAETDLPGGVDDDAVELGPLPQGTSFLRVVTVSGSGVASAPATAPLRVDGSAPRLTLQGLPVGWSDGPVRLTALAADPLSGMAAAGPTGPFTAISADGGAPAIAFGDAVSTWIGGSGVHHASYFARDAAGNVDDGLLGPAPETAAVRIDEEPPRVLFAAAQDPTEPERLEATVADPLSGADPARGSIAVRRVGSGSRFEALPTEVLDDRLLAHWDSDSYPPGKYEFEATAWDRAGNEGSGRDRARGARMVLVNPLKTPVDMEAGFGGRQLVWHHCTREPRGRRCRRRRVTSFDARPASWTVPFGRGVRFGGRLRSAAGVPLGGLTVAVSESFASGSEPRSRTTLVRTGSDGTFSTQLRPGPSRTVSASFPGTRTLTRAAGRSVDLGVLAGVRLRASAASARVGGAPIVFSGSVDGAGAAAAGASLPVELQFRYPGAPWSEFRTVETDSGGRFRYAYRFSDDDSRGVRFQFRAYVNGREGWPYEAAFSRPVAVLGR